MRFHRTKNRVWISLAGVVATAVIGLSGCGGGPSRVAQDSFNSSSIAAEAIKQYDTDGDGRLSAAEWAAAPSLAAAGNYLDTNGDGAVDEAEIATRVQSWVEGRVGRFELSCRVMRGGQPVSGANVTLEPDAFLGEGRPSATGTTDANGVASLSAPTEGPNEIAGVPPGFYLVRITGGNPPIPAKYNSETTLGWEMSDIAGNTPAFAVD